MGVLKGCVKFCTVFVVLLSVALFFLLPDHGHGDFLNPLNTTEERLAHTPEIHKKYVQDFINGNLKVVGIGAPKVIDKFEEVEIPPIHSGWGDDKTQGVKYYKMTDRLYKNLCPSWEELAEQLSQQESFQVAYHLAGEYGARPLGCAKVPRRQMNGTFEDIPERASLYFNSEFQAANELAGRMKEWAIMFVSTFYSDFDGRRLTSPFHNAMSPSIAITCAGNKYWTFVRPRAVAKYGARAFTGASFMRGMDEDEEQFVVQTGAATIISFPPYWAHWVITNPGKSYMYTLRSKYPGRLAVNLLRRLFVERFTLWEITPKSIFGSLSSSFEDAKNATDIHGDDCDSEITKEELDGLYAKMQSVQKEY